MRSRSKAVFFPCFTMIIHLRLRLVARARHASCVSKGQIFANNANWENRRVRACSPVVGESTRSLDAFGRPARDRRGVLESTSPELPSLRVGHIGAAG